MFNIIKCLICSLEFIIFSYFLNVQDNGNGIDIQLPKPLSGSDTNSFAFPTLKDRVPVIICKVNLETIKRTHPKIMNCIY